MKKFKLFLSISFPLVILVLIILSYLARNGYFNPENNQIESKVYQDKSSHHTSQDQAKIQELAATTFTVDQDSVIEIWNGFKVTLPKGFSSTSSSFFEKGKDKQLKNIFYQADSSRLSAILTVQKMKVVNAETRISELKKVVNEIINPGGFMGDVTYDPIKIDHFDFSYDFQIKKENKVNLRGSMHTALVDDNLQSLLIYSMGKSDSLMKEGYEKVISSFKR